MKRNVYIVLFIVLLFNNAFSQLQTIDHPSFSKPVVDAASIEKFVNPLPIIPRLDYTSGGTRTIYMGEGTHDFGLTPGTPIQTKVWGYSASSSEFGYLGATIVAKKDVPLNIQWINNLGYSHPLKIDKTVHWAFAGHHGMSMYDIQTVGVPVVPHLHGGYVDPESDGMPEAWWTKNEGVKGPDFVQSLYTYENNQQAATLWYHDHTLGITRLNVYMGLAAFYLLRDENELDLIKRNKLPHGDEEIELVIQDKMFYEDGELAYPDVPCEDVEGFTPWNDDKPSVQPEFFGEVILVNGKAWPVLNVEPKKYRFRFLNGSDSRFYNLWLTDDVKKDLEWNVIGNDQGFLESSVKIDNLLIAPGERYDVVIDFSEKAFYGKTIITRNNAKTPFPNGEPVDVNTTGLVMAFKVGENKVEDKVNPAEHLNYFKDMKADNTRKLLLFEGMDQFGRMMPMLGIVDPNSIYDGTLTWKDPTTEFPVMNTTEIWEIYNSTVDAHPMHLHLVHFQLLDRQPFTADIIEKHNMTHDMSMAMGGKITNVVKTEMPRKPAKYEKGPKDTGIMYPGEVTRIIAKFDKLGEYVWHCHILSHEDHEMMRRFIVVPNVVMNKPAENATAATFSLNQNYPNPFNPVTNINFMIPESGFSTLKVFDALGNEVKTLISQNLNAGNYNVTFDASALANGVYIYKLQSGSFVETRKMILLK